MPNLTENPHLSKLLRTRGLEISSGYSIALTLNGQPIHPGDVRPEGTVVALCFPENAADKIVDSEPLKLVDGVVVGGVDVVAVVYDESKEGQDDALTMVDCKI